MKESVKAEGMGISQFYERVGEKPELAEALQKARMAKGLEVLEAEAYRRALEGDVKPVYRGGKLVGEVRVYSDKMLMVLLAAQAPEKYGTRRGQKAGERTPEEVEADVAEMVARYREINADHLRMVKEWIAQGRLERPEDWKVDEPLKQDGETGRRGDLEMEVKVDHDQEHDQDQVAPRKVLGEGRRERKLSNRTQWA